MLLIELKQLQKPIKIPARLQASSPLLQFFDDVATLSFLDTLLGRVFLQIIETLDESIKSIISATLSRAASLQLNSGLRSLWTTHFLRLLRLSTTAGIASASVVLVRGAQALVPFSLTADDNSAIVNPQFGEDAKDDSWKQNITEWTTELLSETTLGQDQSRVLAALIYRSEETRTKFIQWLSRAVEAQSSIDGAEAAIRALLEVMKVNRMNIDSIPQFVALRYVDQLLSTSTSTSTSDVRRALLLFCSLSPALGEVVNETLLKRIEILERDSYTPTMLAVLSDLVDLSTSFRGALDAYVNGSLTWLVRRFAEDEVDTEVVLLFCRQLRELFCFRTDLIST